MAAPLPSFNILAQQNARHSPDTSGSRSPAPGQMHHMQNQSMSQGGLPQMHQQQQQQQGHASAHSPAPSQGQYNPRMQGQAQDMSQSPSTMNAATPKITPLGGPVGFDSITEQVCVHSSA